MINSNNILALCWKKHLEVTNKIFPHALPIGKRKLSSDLVRRIIKKLRKLDIKVIYILDHNYWVPDLIKKLDARKLTPKIVITHQKTYVPREWMRRVALSLEYAPKSSRFGYKKFWNFNEERRYEHFLFPAFIDKEIRDKILKTERPIEEPYIFTGGNQYRDYKGLIEGMKLLPDKKLVMIVNNQKIIKKLGQVPSNVTLMGRIPREEFLRWMRHSLAVVIPIQMRIISKKKNKKIKRHHDVMGMTMLSESLLFGKPVITLPKPCMLENLTDRKDSLVVENTGESYQEAIRLIFDDHVLREKLEKEAFRRGDKEIVFESYANNVIKLFNKKLIK